MLDHPTRCDENCDVEHDGIIHADGHTNCNANTDVHAYTKVSANAETSCDAASAPVEFSGP